MGRRSFSRWHSLLRPVQRHHSLLPPTTLGVGETSFVRQAANRGTEQAALEPQRRMSSRPMPSRAARSPVIPSQAFPCTNGSTRSRMHPFLAAGKICFTPDRAVCQIPGLSFVWGWWSAATGLKSRASSRIALQRFRRHHLPSAISHLPSDSRTHAH